MTREKGLDFTRAVGVIGIVAFHFYIHSNSEHLLFLTHANGAWGGTLNFLFFILSGTVLHMKYGTGDKLDLKRFYYRRWKATMPAYLFSFACTFVLQIIKSRQFFHSSVPLYRLGLTFVGMDAYFNMFFPTYFLVGEWFLSAILILYIVYPLLRFLMKKSPLLTLLGLLTLYSMIFQVDFWGVPTTVNLIPGLLCMYIGMLFARSPTILKSGKVALAAGICCGLFILVPIGIAHEAEEILVAATLFLALNRLGDHLCRIRWISKVTGVVSSYAFYIFLVQHRLIIHVLNRYNPSGTLVSLLLLIGIILGLLVFSHNFGFLMKHILGSRLFRKFERAIMGENR